MNNEQTLIRNYIQTLAENYTPIGHTEQLKRFFENSLSEISDPAPGVIMYLAPFIATISEQDGSQVLRMITDITIMQNFERANYADLHAKIRNTYGHCKQIAAKINEDKLNDSPANDTSRLLCKFSLDDTTIEVSDILLDGWAGCRLTFTLILSEEFKTTPELWQ